MAADVEPQGQKFSRYRSVRRQHANLDHEASPPPMPVQPAEVTPTSSTLARSMSRYHRQRSTTFGDDKPPPLPSIPALPSNNAHAITPQSSSTRLRAQSQPQRHHQATNRNPSQGSSNKQVSPAVKSPTRAAAPPLVERHARAPPKDARDEARHLIDAEAERQRKVNARLRAEKEKKTQLEAQEKSRQAEAAKKEEEMNMAAYARKKEEEMLKKVVDQEREQEQRRLKEQLEEERARNQKLQQELESAKRQQSLEEEQTRRSRQRSATLKKLNSNTKQVPTPEKPTQPKHASPTSPQSPARQRSPTRVVKNKFGFLNGKRHDASTRTDDIQTTSPPTYNEDAFIKAGGGGVVPGIDAPISAVNAGDRRVLVQCNKSNIKLPVTPTTTPVDLIRTAETCLSEPIDLKKSVLLESFNKVGVQRPLRRYEHVRDVMNSWDDDMQNTLILVTATHGADEELTAAAVTDNKPQFSGYIYHSNRPGRWKKEWVTLREDGQIVMAKNEHHSGSITNVCHMSDFDIYTPTEKKISKSVRPPKKICFAIKSQQKSAMFMDTSRFVHFFCTNDRDLATQFYKAVQGWRSWYLVNVMGEGTKTKSPQAANAGPKPFKLDLDFDSTSPKKGHSRSTSIDSHYQLGTFQPLLDMNQFSDISKYEARPTSQEGRDTKAMHARKMSTRNKAPPPSSFPAYFSEPETAPSQPARLNSLAKNANPSTTTQTDAFASTGLLGHTYSQRKRDLDNRDTSTNNNNAFTTGPSLLNDPSYQPRPSIDTTSSNSIKNGTGAALNRSGTTKSRHRTSDPQIDSSNPLPRRSSVRRAAGPPLGQPKPLVDLNPVYKEPPQFSNRGKGFKPDEHLSGGLVTAATSLEQLFPAPPPANDWRARVGANPNASMSNLKTSTPASASSPEDESAFTGQGLLAKPGANGWGDGAIGRGVMDGSRARGPMLNVKEDSRFVKGSLLRNVETRQGPSGPVLDREKVREMDVRTGEGGR